MVPRMNQAQLIRTGEKQFLNYNVDKEFDQKVYYYFDFGGVRYDTLKI